jgi:hypothetical protein
MTPTSLTTPVTCDFNEIEVCLILWREAEDANMEMTPGRLVPANWRTYTRRVELMLPLPAARRMYVRAD